MKLKSLLVVLPCAWLASSALGAIVSAPWAGPGEQNLYSILGFGNNAALNAALLNPGSDFTVSTSDAAHYSSLLIEMAGNANNNEFGIYDLNNPLNRLTIFSGPSNPDLTSGGAKQLSFVTFGPSTTISVSGGGSIVTTASDFGFYLDTHNANGTFYSVMTDNAGSEAGFQHVVSLDVLTTAFGQSPYPTAGQSGYIMGWEDLSKNASDADYQDMVVSLTALPIPEPTTVIAGALLLVPFGASTVRTLRRKSAAA